MDATLAELERVQTQILSRISNLELSLLPHNPLPSLSPFYSSPGANGDGDSDRDTGTVARLSNILRSNGVNNFSFKRVPADYYDRSLECRRDLLGAASIDHLCKSIVLVLSCSLLLLIWSMPSIYLFYFLLMLVYFYCHRYNSKGIKMLHARLLLVCFIAIEPDTDRLLR